MLEHKFWFKFLLKKGLFFKIFIVKSSCYSIFQNLHFCFSHMVTISITVKWEYFSQSKCQNLLNFHVKNMVLGPFQFLCFFLHKFSPSSSIFSSNPVQSKLMEVIGSWWGLIKVMNLNVNFKPFPLTYFNVFRSDHLTWMRFGHFFQQKSYYDRNNNIHFMTMLFSTVMMMITSECSTDHHRHSKWISLLFYL